jgi:hypothetical protein
MAWAVSTCLFWAAVLSITFPRLLAAFTPTGAFGFYAGLNMIALCMIFLFVPETKQRTLEGNTILPPTFISKLTILLELDYIFAVPTRTFIRYQLTKTLPYWFNRHVLRRKSLKLEPLYHFDKVVAHPDEKSSSEFN